MDEYTLPLAKILDSVWFNNPTVTRLAQCEDACIGVVAVETFDDTGEWKCYIGVGAGVNRRHDEQQVATYGTGISAREAQGFFPRLDIEKYKAY